MSKVDKEALWAEDRAQQQMHKSSTGAASLLSATSSEAAARLMACNAISPHQLPLGAWAPMASVSADMGNARMSLLGGGQPRAHPPPVALAAPTPSDPYLGLGVSGAPNLAFSHHQGQQQAGLGMYSGLGGAVGSAGLTGMSHPGVPLHLGGTHGVALGLGANGTIPFQVGAMPTSTSASQVQLLINLRQQLAALQLQQQLEVGGGLGNMQVPGLLPASLSMSMAVPGLGDMSALSGLGGIHGLEGLGVGGLGGGSEFAGGGGMWGGAGLDSGGLAAGNIPGSMGVNVGMGPGLGMYPLQARPELTHASSGAVVAAAPRYPPNALPMAATPSAAVAASPQIPHQALLLQQNRQLPPAFFCPLSQVLMTDPVVAADGVTYERSAIAAWLQSNSSSPVTRQHLANKFLAPNYSLRAVMLSHGGTPMSVMAGPGPGMGANSQQAWP